MDALNEVRLGMVRVLIESAPDSAVRNLETALSGIYPGDSLCAVQAMVRSEVTDRLVRDFVLAPLLPLCAPRTDGFKQVLFPQGVVPRLWKAIRHMEVETLAVLTATLAQEQKVDVVPPACDQICRSAAEALAAGQGEMASVAAYLDDFRPGAAAEFAAYLALTPVTRRAARKLPSWLRGGVNDEAAAVVRLLFRDADAIAADASPRLLEILLAHTSEPWKLLRIISVVTKRGGDRYLSTSELAEFCQRILGEIDRHMALLRAFDPDNGPDAAIAAASAIAQALVLINEFQVSLDLSREGPWGQRLAKQKAELSVLAEGHIKKAFKLVGEALPLSPLRPGLSRPEPNLSRAPDPKAVARAGAALLFVDRCRGSAATAGYGSLRSKMLEAVSYDLDGYAEDLLAVMREEKGPEAEMASIYLETAAEFISLVVDGRAADVVRRRAAA